MILEEPEVQATFGVGGFAFGGSSANSGVIFTPLKPWGERRSPNQSAQAIIGRLWGKFAMIPEARIIPLNPPFLNRESTVWTLSHPEIQNLYFQIVNYFSLTLF